MTIDPDAAPLPTASENATNLTRRPHGPGGALARAGLVLGALLLPLGWLAPMLETRRFFFVRDQYSLIETLEALAESGEIALALTVAAFSVLLPGLKTAVLLWLNLAGRRGMRSLGLLLLRNLGKWSMLEVFVAALVVVSLSGSGIASASTLPGHYLFAASALLLMLASGRVERDLRPA